VEIYPRDEVLVIAKASSPVRRRLKEAKRWVYRPLRTRFDAVPKKVVYVEEEK